MTWAATRFDGRSAAGETVIVRIDGDALVVVSGTSLERHALRDVDAGEPLEHAPRMVALPGGATLEMPDPERTFPAALRNAGVEEPRIVQLQRMPGLAAGAVMLLVGLVATAYFGGIPMAARWLAHALPWSVEQRLGDRLLAVMDEHRFRPSRLPSEDRERISARFREAAARAAPGVPVRVEFREGPVNAFAVPGGTIVLFDELVRLAGSDERLLGVLGHELGHVVHRHSTRQLFQLLGVGAIAGLVWGDFSTVATNVPIALGVMRYGREFEEEADRYAVMFMRANGLSARPLWEMFVRLHAHHDRGGGRLPEFLSTHPGTASRIQALRREMEAEAQAPAPAPVR